MLSRVEQLIGQELHYHMHRQAKALENRPAVGNAAAAKADIALSGVIVEHHDLIGDVVLNLAQAALEKQVSEPSLALAPITQQGIG